MTINIPYLMPHQLDPFNGDEFIQREVLRLRDRFDIDTAVETGTCFGGTTAFLAQHFNRVITLELNPAYLEIARQRLGPATNVYTYLGATEEILDSVLEEQAPFTSTPFFYLDAHWQAHSPLPDELLTIARRGLRPVIAIHDMQVPGQSGMAFDTYNAQPYTFGWIRPLLDTIYGPDGYEHYFNSEADSMTVKVGVLYIIPKDADTPPLVAANQKQKRVSLYVNYYNDPHPQRQQELYECLSRNLNNPLIHKIYTVIESENVDFQGLDQSEKLEKTICQGRPPFSYLLALARRQAGWDDITILANADIYFEAYDLGLVMNYLDPASCFALSRWERGPDGTLQLLDHSNSQDCWLFRGAVRQIPRCDFVMGTYACDNAIAHRIAEAGYRLYNPSRTIRAIHVHNTAIRHYDPATIVELPHNYVPTSSLGYLPVTNWITEIPLVPPGGHYSQIGEEGLIDYIFAQIGLTNRYYVDLGAGAYGDSTMSNTRWLRQSGWSGYGVDMRSKGEEGVIERFIKPDNIVAIMQEQHTPQQFDFLNLDLDSCDFWVLKSVLGYYAPRCICTEFNGTLNPVLSVVLEYQDGYTWDQTNKYGYSFGAGKKLLGEHGYRIVHNMGNQNIFAVREDLVRGLVFQVGATQMASHPENPWAIWEAY